MKRVIYLLFTLLFMQFGHALADVYVSPEEHRAWAKEGLEKQLAEVPKNKQVEFVEQKLKEMPLKRMDLEMKVKAAEEAQAKGEHSGPPAYFLRKGFEGFDYEEEALKNWLAQHGQAAKSGDKKPAKKSEAKPSPSPSATSKAKPLAAASEVPTTPSSPAGSFPIIAVLLLAAGGLLGLRRALA